MGNIITESENLARKMGTVAHHYDHADQVRKYVIALGKEEGMSERDLFILEVAALWHDIGLDYVENRSDHPDEAVRIFSREFEGEDALTTKEKEVIKFLIKYHDKYKEAEKVGDDSQRLKLLRILIDADTLELLGKRGYERAVETAVDRNWPKYDSDNPLGETSGFSAKQFDNRFSQKRSGVVTNAIEPTLVGQLNFQISCADLLYTESAKHLAVEGVAYLKNKIGEITS